MYELMPFGRRMRSPAPFDPFREMDDFFASPRRDMQFNPFSTDVIDNGDSFQLNAELPGFSKEDIKLDIENDCLTISAERKFEENDEKPNFVKRERFWGSYSRSFDMTGIDVDNIEAKYSDGVLSLTLPKIKEEAPVKKTVEIK